MDASKVSKASASEIASRMTVAAPAGKSASCRWPWMLFAALIAVWVSFYALTTPEIAGEDSFLFRAAGCNYAAGLGLVAASLPGGIYPHPILFSSYTPGAPLLFGVAARLFGCHPYTDTYYNLIFGVMHELSIVSSVLDQLDEWKKQHGGRQISKVGLRVGELAGVDVDCLHGATFTPR